MKEVNFFEQIAMMADVVEFVEENTKGIDSKEIKMSLLCTISDVLFGAESVKVFKECVPYIEEVNAELGAYNS